MAYRTMGNISHNKDLDSVLGKYFLTDRIFRGYFARGYSEIPVIKDIPAEEGNTRAACIGWKMGQDGYDIPFHDLIFFTLQLQYNFPSICCSSY